MEGAGVATASFQSPNAPGFFMVRGVSDLANEKKDDRWRLYACDVAAAYTIGLLKRGPVVVSSSTKSAGQVVQPPEPTPQPNPTPNPQPSSSQLPADFVDRLLDILLKVPAFNDPANRDSLLWRLPSTPVTSIPRHSAKMTDLRQIITHVQSWGQLDSGELGLVIVTKNALQFVSGTQHGRALEDLLGEVGK